nr:hypothetical protein [uncultured Actinoplanes sp.]
MDLGEILRVMRSRWYIVVPMMLLAAGLGLTAFVVTPTSYTTYTMVSLLSAPSATKTATMGQDNPFLNFNDSLVATADFLGRRLESTDVQLQLKSAGVTEEYKVTMAENAQGPFLTITLTGDDKAHLLESAATLARFADTTLVTIQEQNGVKEKDQIRLTQVIPAQKPEAELKKKIEFVIAAAGGTMALTFVLTFVVESVSRRRAQAEEAAGKAEETATPPVVHSSSVPVPRTPVVNGKANVGDETRVLHAAPAATPRVPEKKQAAGVPAPDSTAIIAKPLPVNGEGLRKKPDASPAPARQTGAPAGENPSRGKAVVPPAAGTPRVGSSTTYQSKSADRRGQDANRVNGS